MLKNTVLHSLAKAFASIVFPVPGGPNNKTPFQGLILNLLKNSGCSKGICIASLTNHLAFSSPIISLKVTLVSSLIISHFI
jgi:hypothetical protein